MPLVPNIDMCTPTWKRMGRNGESGEEALARIAGKDLNEDGVVINLIICGNSRYYNYSFIEQELELWVKYNGYPDVVILGGASGVDYLAERWADNNNIPLVVFQEAWTSPRPNRAEDTGRPEATADLADRMVKYATHMLAFPGPKSKWTKRMEETARKGGIPVVSIPLPME